MFAGSFVRVARYDMHRRGHSGSPRDGGGRRRVRCPGEHWRAAAVAAAAAEAARAPPPSTLRVSPAGFRALKDKFTFIVCIPRTTLDTQHAHRSLSN